MKYLLAPILCILAAPAMAQNIAKPALAEGSAMPIGPVTSAKWIQGEPLKAFEPGKVYLFECWATWCGPCVAAIPHINALHLKYASKGLRVYGMNVFEDDPEKAAKFVKAKGEGMSYPVVFTGKGSAFENEWLKPAGIANIPRAFVVRDGKLVMICHPDYLTEARVEQLLSGDEGAREASASVSSQLNARKMAAEMAGRIQGEFIEAATKNDIAIMAEKVTELEKITPASVQLNSMKLELAMTRKDWPAAIRMLETVTPSLSWNMVLNSMAVKRADSAGAECPPGFSKALLAAYTRGVETNPHPLPGEYLNLASLQWKSADRQGAIANARKALELAPTINAGTYPVEPIDRFLKSLEAGNPPSQAELAGWIREAAAKRAANSASEKIPAGS